MKARKITALIAAGIGLLGACGSDAEVAETGAPESQPAPPAPTSEAPASPGTDSTREVVEDFYEECQAEYVAALAVEGLVEDPDSAVNEGGRFEEDRSGIITVYGNTSVDGKDQIHAWECTLSDGRNHGEWEIIYIGHGR